MGLELVQTLLWNVPYVLFPLLGFLVLFFAPAGRRLLPALGLVLMLIDGLGDLLLSGAFNAGLFFGYSARMLSPDVMSGARHVLNLIYTVGLLLVVIGIVRKIRTAPGRAPDPAWSAPPPTPAGHGYAGPAGNPGYGVPVNLSGGHGGHGGPAQPSGPNPGAGVRPASSGRQDTGPQPGPPSSGSGPNPSAAPPASPGPGGHRPPATPPQSTG